MMIYVLFRQRILPPESFPQRVPAGVVPRRVSDITIAHLLCTLLYYIIIIIIINIITIIIIVIIIIVIISIEIPAESLRQRVFRLRVSAGEPHPTESLARPFYIL